jgi:flagellar motor switch protein FliG
MSGESPSLAAMVLSELPAKKGAAVLALLSDAVRVEAVRGMADGQQVSPEVRKRVAGLIMSRLRTAEVAGQTRKDQQLRRTAILLRSLPAEARNKVLQAMTRADQQTAQSIQRAMVTWEDIVDITDRSLQDALRGVDSRKLALAMVGADQAIIRKIRSNVSERAGAMLDEETSLLSSPKPPDIADAREHIVSGLRELNANNMLNFDES